MTAPERTVPRVWDANEIYRDMEDGIAGPRFFVEKSWYDELHAKYNFMVDSAQQNAKERDALVLENERLRAALARIEKVGNSQGTNKVACARIARDALRVKG